MVYKLMLLIINKLALIHIFLLDNIDSGWRHILICLFHFSSPRGFLGVLIW